MCGQLSPFVMCSFFFLLNRELHLKGRTTCKFFGCTVWLAGILVSQLGIKPTSSAVNACSPNHWTARNSVLHSSSILQVEVQVLQLDTLTHTPFIAMHEQSHCHGRRIVLMGQAQGMGAGVTLRRKIQNLTFSDCLYPHSVIPQQTKKSAVILRHKILLGSINQVRFWWSSLSFWASPSQRGSLSQAASCPSHSSPAGSSLDAAAWYAGSGHSPGSGASSSSWCSVKAAWRGMSRCGPGRSSNLCIPWCLEESRAGMEWSRGTELPLAMQLNVRCQA